MAGKELKERARQSGIAERTLYRAAKSLGVKTTSGGFGKSRLWHMCANSLMCAMCAKENGREKAGTDGTNDETDPMPAKSAKKFTSVLDGTHCTHGQFGTHEETSRAHENEADSTAPLDGNPYYRATRGN